MRHQTLPQPHAIDALDVAAVWPSTTQLAPLPVPDRHNEHVTMGAEAAPDMPLAAGAFMVLIYSVLLAVLAIGTAGSGKSLFAIGVDVFFLLMFFAIPAAFLGVGNGGRRHPTLARFMEDGVQTLTGHTSGRAALVQMLVVPVMLTLGMICIAISAAVIL